MFTRRVHEELVKRKILWFGGQRYPGDLRGMCKLDKNDSVGRQSYRQHVGTYDEGNQRRVYSTLHFTQCKDGDCR